MGIGTVGAVGLRIHLVQRHVDLGQEIIRERDSAQIRSMEENNAVVYRRRLSRCTALSEIVQVGHLC